MSDVTKAKIPLLSALAAIPLLVYVIFWVSGVYSSGVNAERTNERQDGDIKEIHSTLTEIKEGVIRIEERLKRRKPSN